MLKALIVTDPLCSWCWGMSPAVEEFVYSYGNPNSFHDKSNWPGWAIGRGGFYTNWSSKLAYVYISLGDDPIESCAAVKLVSDIPVAMDVAELMVFRTIR